MGAGNPARSLLARAVLLAVGAFMASSIGTNAMAASPEVTDTPEVHGKLSVKLSNNFSLTLPKGATGVAWSPDGSILAVSGNYGTKLSTFDASGHPLSEFQSEGNKGAYINSFAFIKGSSQVLFPVESKAPIDATLDIRDTATGRIVQTLTRTQARILPESFAVSPDQKRFAIANSDGKTVVTYGSDNGVGWHELSAATVAPHIGVISLSFFPDNKLIAVGESKGHFAVVDSTTGEVLKDFHAYDAPGVFDNVDSIAVNPKGDLILTGLGGGAISPILATPEAWAWARSDHAKVSIWRISDGKQIAGFPDKDKLIRQAVWDPKGRFVAFIDNDTLFIWEPDAIEKTYIKLPYPNLATSLAITRDGKSLAVTEGTNVVVYNIEDNQ